MSSEDPSNDSSTDLTPANAAPGRINATDLFDALANDRRQFVIRTVADGEQTIGGLAEQLARAEHDIPKGARVDGALRKRAYVALYQQHLGALEEVSIVSWDQQSGAVAAGPNHEQALRTLRYATDGDAADRLIADGGHPICTNCDERIIHTTVSGPSMATNSCGCSVHPDLATDGGRSLLDSSIEELGDEYEQEFIRNAIEAIEDVGAEPTVDHVEAVLGDVESEIDAAVAAVEKLPVRSPEGGESA